MPSALGDEKTWGNASKSVCILAPATANNAIPTLDTQGISMYVPPRAVPGTGHKSLAYGGQPPKSATLCIAGTATTGQTLVGTFTLWGYHPVLGWLEIPVNGGTAITPVALAETDTDKITYTQRFEDVSHFQRLYLQLTAIGGTGASFEAWMTTAMDRT
jgi:hypothetical protein